MMNYLDRFLEKCSHSENGDFSLRTVEMTRSCCRSKWQVDEDQIFLLLHQFSWSTPTL